jgi:hypothetical protein
VEEITGLTAKLLAAMREDLPAMIPFLGRFVHLAEYRVGKLLAKDPATPLVLPDMGPSLVSRNGSSPREKVPSRLIGIELPPKRNPRRLQDLFGIVPQGNDRMNAGGQLDLVTAQKCQKLSLPILVLWICLPL